MKNNMKSLDLFCASPASTAICSSTDPCATVQHGMPPTRRHVHRLGERPKGRTQAPCSTQLPMDPRQLYRKSRRSDTKQSETRRKSSADVSELVSPASSTRYLLSDKPFVDYLLEGESFQALVPRKPLRTKRDDLRFYRSLSTTSYESPVYKSSTEMALYDTHVQKHSTMRLSDHQNVHKSPLKSSNRDSQVVELRVSIHCKGCEGKLRKHISRMEGVTSFSIDLPTKKVTVVGDVTPLGVLTSISKVKNAQFWASPASSSPRMVPTI